MPIIRRQLDFERREFTQIPNAWLRDERLSLKSKGLLAQILSHAPGWSMTINTLSKANNCGYHTIAAAIQELETAGYLTRVQTKDDKGRFSEMLWITTEPGEPLLDYPMSENPRSENPKLKKTIEKKTKEKNIQETSGFSFDQFWEQYPRKAGKASARKVFIKLSDEDRSKAMDGVERLRNDPNLPPTQFVPYPATWLNREGWEDDPYPKRELPPSQKPAETPGPGDWRKWYCDQGDHVFCDHERRDK